MPTILIKKSDTASAVPGTANLTNLAGGAEVAVNTADRRMFTMNSSSAVVELGTNPSSLTCADGSFTLLKAASASITNLTATSLVLSNLSIASANVTTLTSASATITNLLATTLTVSGVGIFPAGSASSAAITTTGDTNTGIFFPAADTIAFAEGGVEAARFDSSGNLGIGTNSPTLKLDVNGSAKFAGNYVSFNDNGYIRTDAANILRFQPGSSGYEFRNSANSANLAVLDSSGNLGLGVTPAAGSVHLDVSNGASLYGLGAGTQIAANASFNGSSWLYRATNVASRMDIAPGGASGFAWFTAPSGTAGNAITFTQAMTLDASGNLGIGTGSPLTRLHLSSSSATYIQITDEGDGASRIGQNGTALTFGVDLANGATERARITSGGDFCVGSTSALGKLDVYQTGLARGAYFFIENASNTSDVLRLDCSRNTTNNSYNFLLCAIPGVATRLTIADSGNVANTNGTYGTISDQKLKQDITDAPSQWDDIKNIRFRKYRFKSDVATNPDAPSLLGVVAQELEQVCPGLVEERADRDDENNDLGTTTKTVKSSILLMKAAVALQEAMSRIESLEAKVAALEAK